MPSERIRNFEELRKEIVTFGSGRRVADDADAFMVIDEPEVLVLHLPGDEAALAEARSQGTARFVVLEDGAAPPTGWDPAEDWIRVPADRRDVETRVAALRRRTAAQPHRPAVDGYDRVFMGKVWVALSPSEYKLIEPLVEHFDEVVPYSSIGSDADETSGAVARRVRLARLRQRIAPLGLRILTIRPHGLLLTTEDASASVGGATRV